MSEMRARSPIRSVSVILVSLLAQGGVSLMAGGESIAAAGQSQAVNEKLTDPTRPPASAIRIVETKSGGAGVAVKGKAPGSAEQPDSAPLVLSAVFVSDKGRLAIINGRRVRAGDEIGGMSVRAIGSSHVELDGKRGAITLELAGIRVKRPAHPLGEPRKGPVTK